MLISEEAKEVVRESKSVKNNFFSEYYKHLRLSGVIWHVYGLAALLGCVLIACQIF